MAFQPLFGNMPTRLMMLETIPSNPATQLDVKGYSIAGAEPLSSR